MGDGFIPRRHSLLLGERSQLAVFIWHQYLAAGMESGADILLAGAGDIEGIAPDRERFGHLVQMAGSLFAVARYPSLIANPCGQIPDNQTDGEHYAKRQQILNIGYRQRTARSDKHQVKAHHVHHPQ